MSQANTLLLNPTTWDLVVDANRNIAVCGPPYSQAQSAANAIRLFQGEDYYNSARGIPYWQFVLGKWPPIQLMKAYFVAATLTVPDVVTAVCFLNAIGPDRIVSGQVQITNDLGQTAVAGF